MPDDASADAVPTGAPTGAIEPVADLILSAEVARPGVRQVTAGTVRIGKRIVTETRTVTVEVRREELYVERTAAPEVPLDLADGADGADGAVGANASAPGAPGQGPVLVLALLEEVPEVVIRVVATERVSVFVDRVEGTETVDTDLRHEEVALTEEHSRR